MQNNKEDGRRTQTSTTLPTMDLTLCHWELKLILQSKKPGCNSLDYGPARTVFDVHSMHRILTYKSKQ
jgi:hypothetical protein